METVRKCRACVFVYIDMAPEYEHLAVVLDWDKTHAAEIQRKAKTRRISYKLSRRTSVRNRRFLPQRRVHKFCPQIPFERTHDRYRVRLWKPDR